MTFVVDASMTVAWHFVDEKEAIAEAAAQRALVEGVHVPAHWAAEISNALLVGERRQRTDGEAVSDFLDRVGQLFVTVDRLQQNDIFERILPLARMHGLTVYDACYLELAVRRRLPLATFDKALAHAGRAVGIPIIGDEP